MNVSNYQGWHEFPRYSNYKKGTFPSFLSFFIGILFWIIFVFIFLFFAFVNVLSKDISYLMFIITNKHKIVPIWVCIILTIFFLPLSLIFVLLVQFYKLIKE